MKIEVTKQHNLNVDVIMKRLQMMVVSEEEKFGHLATSIDHDWNEQSLTTKLFVMGSEYVVTTRADDGQVRVETDVPFVLRPFRDKIIRMIEFRLNKVIASQ